MLNKTVDEYNEEIIEVGDTITRLEKIRVQTTYTRQETLDEIDYLTVNTITPEEWEERMGDRANTKSFKTSYRQLRVKIMPTFKTQNLIQELMKKYK